MADLALVPFLLGEPVELVEAVASYFARRWSLSVEVCRPWFDPDSSLSSVRGQHDAVALLASLEQKPPAPRVLGITDADLFVSVLTFVIGLGRLGGAAAVVSTHRLRNERLGMPSDPELLFARLTKEAVHELGHTFGLTHCLDPGCAMGRAATAGEVDIKGDTFIGHCQEAFVAAKEAVLRKQPIATCAITTS
jgi:archaemetzincin